MARVPEYQWTDEVERYIFRRVGRGDSISAIFGREGRLTVDIDGVETELPNRYCFMDRLSDEKEFAERYWSACVSSQFAISEEIIDTARGTRHPTDGMVSVKRDTLIVSALTDHIHRLNFARFGRKESRELTGKDGAELKPFTVVVSSVLDRDK